MGHLFVSASFLLTGRGRFLFDASKRKWGRIPRKGQPLQISKTSLLRIVLIEILFLRLPLDGNQDASGSPQILLLQRPECLFTGSDHLKIQFLV